MTARLKMVTLSTTQNFLVLLFSLILIRLTSAQEVDLGGLLPPDYDAGFRPGGLWGPMNVSISLYVNDLLNTENKDQTITLDITLVQQWVDRRLNTSVIGRNRNFIVTDSAVINRFWTPKLYFVNGISVATMRTIGGQQRLTITGDSLLSYSQHVRALMMCPMNLQNFPHDIQYCALKLSNLVYNQTQVRLVWANFEAQDKYYPTFRIRFWWTSDCPGWENPMPENSCIAGNLKLVRRLSYYIIRYYLLTFLCVAISVVHLWLPINGWPARITFLVMPLLNLIQQDIAINNEHGVYYVTSFHWWMMWLQGIIYLGIVEYAVAIAWGHFICDKKYYAALKEQAKNVPEGSPPIEVPDFVEGYYFGNKGFYAKCGAFFDRFNYFFFGQVDYKLDPYTRNKVDYTCRVLFVTFLVSFTFFYTMITVPYWSANFYHV